MKTPRQITLGPAMLSGTYQLVIGARVSFISRAELLYLKSLIDKVTT